MRYLLQHLLMESGQRQPEKQAIVLGCESLTYRQLDERSNQLAHALLANGCERGDRVAIFMPKSISGIVGIHAVLKAGCIYVPLDARAPWRRLAYILRDCGVKCVLAAASQLGALGSMLDGESPLEVVILTDAASAQELDGGPRVVSWQQVTEYDGTRPPAEAGIETDLAYVLYTSGSTGVPKGVMISHLNSLTFVRWACETLGVRSDDRISGHAPLHFDLSIFDVFATFMAGATLFPVPEGTSTFPLALADWIAEHEISVWYSVPSVLSRMVRQGKLDRHDFPRLRRVLFAGEVFPVKYLRAWMAKVPAAEFYNLYGPTETNVITYYRVDELPARQTRGVPIGRACANMEVCALKEDGRLVTEPGEEGELYARGSCVAQGYWGDAEKTRSVFLSGSPWPHLADRLYRTGDIVTLDEDGNYVYVGRRDHMIKRRGYRIELGEIEAVLYRHPGVKEAAVIGRPDELDGNRIEVFAVAADDGTTPLKLKRWIADALPKYMVPDRLELLPKLPRTSTGKIDKRALLSAEEPADSRATSKALTPA